MLNTNLKILILCFVFQCLASANEVEVEETVVIGLSPGTNNLLDSFKAPYKAQKIDSSGVELSLANDLPSSLERSVGGVHLTDAQNNPFQKDLSFRGYSSSPLLGVSQGLSIYLRSTRLNEPLGQEVNWDMIPISAVSNLTLISGATPLFGLNSLGGSLSLETKTGFSFDETRVDLSTGSWGRHTANIQHGGNNGRLGYYVNFSYTEEDGWRDLSESELHNVYGALSFRNELISGDVYYLHGNSDLAGNGAVPEALLQQDRDSIFTAPDLTENKTNLVIAEFDMEFLNGVEFGFDAFYRKTKTNAFNGDASELSLCRLGAGEFLIEGLRENIGELNGISENAICGGANIFGADTVDDLEDAINASAAGLDFDLDDVDAEEISGTGLLSDSAINNISDREQESYGFSTNFGTSVNLLGLNNTFDTGLAFNEGLARFNSVTELSLLDPLTRSTRALGLGTFLNEEATNVSTRNQIWEAYVNNVIELSDDLLFSIGLKYFYADIEIADRSGERPELNGEHQFDRPNYTLGLSYSVSSSVLLYGNYGESSRIPTPIELSCNEGVFQVAQSFAVQRGQDPDDIDFECRLPNAFVADPPLKQVVAKGFEVGGRVNFEWLEADLSYHNHTNHDDIIFQSTGRSTGLFANVDETKREGVDFLLRGTFEKFDFGLNYNFLKATFEDELRILSPNHPFASANGEVLVSSGDYLPSIPKHQLKVFSTLRVTEKLTLSPGMTFTSKQFLRGDESNQLPRLDSYVLFDVSARYRITTGFSWFLKIDNLFDNDYENFGVVGEDPSSVIPSISTNPERFLSPGAPRGIWLGLKVSI